jgi:hypothetical protein
VNGVAAEVVNKVIVLLDHAHAAPSSREQQSGHKAGGPAADYHDVERIRSPL